MARKLGLLELEVYSTIFKELQKTWASASLVYKLLNVAMLRFGAAEGHVGAAIKQPSAHPQVDFEDHILTPALSNEAQSITNQRDLPQALAMSDLWEEWDVTSDEFWNRYSIYSLND